MKQQFERYEIYKVKADFEILDEILQFNLAGSILTLY